MRLASYDRDGTWRAGIVVGESLVDAAAVATHAGLDAEAALTVKGLLGLGADALAQLEEAAGDAGPERLPLASLTLGPPVPDAGKVLCIGLNYRAHAGEAELEEPSAPIVFPKWQSALIGPGATIELPAVAPDHVDWEGEIGVVIGTRAKGVSEADALAHVAGWMPFHDVSARDLQTATSQWAPGKACDTFGPCGPFLSLDGRLEADDLHVETKVNGTVEQSADSSEMIFSVAKLVSFISGWMTLEPGDIIATGTPQGVGGHRTPPVFLAPGDVVTITVGDQVLENPVAHAA